MDTIIKEVLQYLNSLPKELTVIIIASMPIGELRFSIPIGIYLMGKEFIVKIFLLSILGNAIPVIPLLLLLNPVSDRLRHFRLWRKFFDWMAEKTKQKGKIIQKYESIGLAIFVSLPTPGSGIWTGCLAASLFKIKFRYALPAILIGMVFAGIFTTILAMTGILVWQNVTGG